MPEYKEKQIAGRSYQRCNQIVVDNAFGTVPRMSFGEEEILHIDGGNVVVRAVPGTVLAYDPADVIPLLNPLTGEPLGQSVPHSQVHVLLYSAYKHAAAKRDEAEAAQNQP